MKPTGSSLNPDDISNNGAAIIVKDLWKSYGNDFVLKGVDLVVPKGKIFIILGRSGVGKSVLLRQILGLERPNKGSIDVDGIRITDLEKQELFGVMHRFGMLFQSSALFDSLTIGENIAFYLYHHGDPISKKQLPKSEIDDHVRYALEKVGLAGYEKKMPSMLSGGQKRRAALARLIIYKPKIILYDEPTTGLDPITSKQINELIVTTQAELHATSIVVTHDIHSALEIGDLFGLHHDGKVLYVDEKERFLENNNPIIRDFFLNAMIAPKYTQMVSR